MICFIACLFWKLYTSLQALQADGEGSRQLKASACNLQESISLFGILLTGPIFASGELPIPKTTESIIDNCQLSEKQHRLEQNYGPKSSAQHPTLRGRKGIYKTHMSLTISAEAHARKMKAISVDISFMGNPHEALPHTRRMKNLMNPQILLPEFIRYQKNEPPRYDFSWV